ncbi:DUF3168 domain-containing protein [Caulobacter mirabilis]|uniref:DUF3168 domain-containing protein n=1 Tax=Caulobacter mirabilis TaxID=69666 RepID=A0A2D2AVY6_9CAUL|nr:DUF3168 domain-containing protein [Caulobacter mirabilis]ATQ42135.1 hypothetical protein CSW64_06750 [Caulobacter mirabilis]
MSPDLALQQALLAHLRADPALAALLGDPPRIHDAPPQARVFPHLVFGRAETRPWGGLDGEGLEHALTLTCLSHFDGAEEAKAVIAAVRARLHGADLALDGHRLVNLRVAYADVFRAPDWRPVVGVVRLRAVTEPL